MEFPESVNIAASSGRPRAEFSDGLALDYRSIASGSDDWRAGASSQDASYVWWKKANGGLECRRFNHHQALLRRARAERADRRVCIGRVDKAPMIMAAIPDDRSRHA